MPAGSRPYYFIVGKTSNSLTAKRLHSQNESLDIYPLFSSFPIYPSLLAKQSESAFLSFFPSSPSFMQMPLCDLDVGGKQEDLRLIIEQRGMDDDYEMFKIVIIGSTGTGKTNIATRYIRNEFNEGQKATVGVQFLSKIVQVRNQNIKVTLWDTAGQERYKSLSKVYYKGASGVLIVYDVTEPQSYLDVESWMRLANENLNLNEVVLMVVGNKIDMEQERRVPNDRPIREYKDKFDIDCWEVSAKTGYNVREIFSELLERIYEKNIEIKSSAFHDPTDYDDSVIRPPSITPVNKKAPPPKPEPVMEEIIEDREEDNRKKKPAQQQPPQPKAPPSQVDSNATTKKTQQPQGKKEKDNRMTLKANDEKKRKEEEKNKKKGCC